jgi:hypothetical protein
MDDIQRRADDEAWGKKQDGWISDLNRKNRRDELFIIAFAVKIRHAHSTEANCRDDRSIACGIRLLD